MSFTKSDIAKNIAKKTSISNQTAKELLDNFIKIIVSNSDTKLVKISRLGIFVRKKTPSRIGRNPKTGEVFEITERTKLNFRSSNKIKKKIN